MTAKGIAQLRKVYAHVANMDPQQLKQFEGSLIVYRNIQQGAIQRTRKEHVASEISPTLVEVQNMLLDVQKRILDTR